MTKYLILALSGIALLYSGWLATGLLSGYSDLKGYKEDLAEIHKVNYGLFNLQIWKKEALRVFENRIGEFEISPSAYRQVEKELEKYLHGINREYLESGKIFENIFAEAEKSEKVNKVFLKLVKDNAVPQIQKLDIPRFIPGMAVQLAKELKKQEPQLRDVMRAELIKILDKADMDSYVDPRISLYNKYGTSDLISASSEINNRINLIQSGIEQRVRLVFGILAACFLIAWALSGWTGQLASVITMTLASVLMLILGVSLPMIDIEALLNSFTLKVMGTEINFDRQYIYYQSKSILDVTRTLLEGRGLDLKIVGLMVLCFSVVFPFIKLILTAIFVLSEKAGNSSAIKNIIFYLGKWSMADVFVVALFMAYIGFYGIVNAQLDQIEHNRTGFAVETVNQSHLSPGALFFTSYCVMSIILGMILNKKAV